MRLISCDWIRHHQNIIINGPTGAGKSFLACALANKACREGYRTFYIRSPQLYYELVVSKGDGSYGKMINKLAKTNILLLDDLGARPHDGFGKKRPFRGCRRPARKSINNHYQLVADRELA